MAGSAVDSLRRRVATVDDQPLPLGVSDDPVLVHLVVTLSSYTDVRMEADGAATVLQPDEADTVVASCRRLAELSVDEPSVARGPIDVTSQQWIAAARSSSVPEPSFDRLVPAAPGPHPPSTKPFHLGLFTSTVGRRGSSMWRIYLDLFRGSELFPLPWSIWQVRPADGCRVLEIDGARQWCELVTAYPTVADDAVYPNWSAVAADFDGVHMTLSAILATQGLRFPIRHGLTAAPYWDVESTLWLRWVFSSVAFRERIG